MNLLHLRYAVEVDATRSITKAAENLFMGQPNLSRAIRELEESIGLTVFRRTSKGIVPTLQGEEFLLHARRVLAEIDEMEARYQPDDAGRAILRISIARADYLAQAFCDLAASPDCAASELHCQETDAVQTLENLLTNNHSLGVLRCRAERSQEALAAIQNKGLKAELLWEFSCVVLMARSHPLAGRKTLTLSELRGLPELCYAEADFPPVFTKSPLLASEHQKIYVGDRGGRNDLLCALPAYLWASPAPVALLERCCLAQVPCNDAPRHADLLISRGDGRLSPAELQFLDALQRVRERLPQG